METKQTGLNLKIAELLGLSYSIIAKRIHVFPNEDSNYNYIFDPINDPVQREPLIIELIHAKYYPYFDGKVYGWAIGVYGLAKDKHFSMASCLAWVEMKRNKDGKERG